MDVSTNVTCAIRIQVTTIRFVLLCLSSLVAIFGIIANGILAKVFIRSKLVREPNSAILAVLDWLLCVVYIFVFGTVEALAYYLKLEFLYNALYGYALVGFSISKVIQLGIPALLVLTLVQRWAWLTHRRIGFWRPLHMSRCRGVIGLCLLLVAILCRLPALWSVVVKEFPNCTDHFRTQEIWVKEIYFSKSYRMYDECMLWVHVFVPFALLLALNTAIVYKLRKRRVNRQNKVKELVQYRRTARRKAGTSLWHDIVVFKISHTVQEDANEMLRNENNAIFTMAIIVSTYLACNFAHVILTIIEKWKSGLQIGDAWSDAYIFAIDAVNFLFMLTSAIRLYVYYKFNPVVRHELKPILFCYGWRSRRTNYKALFTLHLNDVDGLLRSTLGVGLKLNGPQRKTGHVLLYNSYC